MGTTLSKTVRVRADNAAFVATSGEVHGPQLEPELVALFQKLGLPPPAPGAVKAVVGSANALLGAATRKLMEVESAYVDEQADDETPRLERDEAASEVRAKLVDLRAVLGSASAGARLRAFALDGAVPMRPADLHHYASTTLGLLSATAEEVPLLGSRLNTADLAADLGPAVDRLGAALQKVGVEERELQLGLEQRDAVLADWVRVYRGVANVLSALFRLAGRDTLAEKVRPTERQLQGKDEAAPPETGSGTEAGTGAATAGTGTTAPAGGTGSTDTPPQ